MKYLGEYNGRLEKEYQRNIEKIGEGKFYKFELEPFEFLLPEYYPYFGKLIEVDVVDIDADGKFKKPVEGLYYPKDFKVVDTDNLARFREKEMKVPVMLEMFNREEKVWEVSVGKGLLIRNFMEQPGLGIEATVERIDKNAVILDYYGVKLKLNIENLIKDRKSVV